MNAMRKNITAEEAKSYKLAQGEKMFRRTFRDLSITFNAAKTLDDEERSAIWAQSLEFDDNAIRKEGLRTFYTVVTNHQEPAQRKHHLYRHFDKDGVLLYVGISNDAAKRLSGHKHVSSWFDEIATVTIQAVGSRREAMRLERIAISEEKPKYNISMGNHGGYRNE